MVYLIILINSCIPIDRIESYMSDSGKYKS